MLRCPSSTAVFRTPCAADLCQHTHRKEGSLRCRGDGHGKYWMGPPASAHSPTTTLFLPIAGSKGLGGVRGGIAVHQINSIIRRSLLCCTPALSFVCQITSIKEALYSREGISVAQIRLIFGGKQLNDTDTIGGSKIKAGETIHMVLSLRGGSC